LILLLVDSKVILNSAISKDILADYSRTTLLIYSRKVSEDYWTHSIISTTKALDRYIVRVALH
jgi:hypothetical protein